MQLRLCNKNAIYTIAKINFKKIHILNLDLTHYFECIDGIVLESITFSSISTYVLVCMIAENLTRRKFFHFL